MLLTIININRNILRFISNRLQRATTQRSFNSKVMNKLWYIYTVEYYAATKIITNCYIDYMDESNRLNTVERNKPEKKKEYILYDSTDTKLKTNKTNCC